MVSYVNVHAILEGRRNRAKASSSDDPVSSQVIYSCIVISKLDAWHVGWCGLCLFSLIFCGF